MKPFIFILLIIISSCTTLYTKRLPLVDKGAIGFGMDKDSIFNLTKINFDYIDDSSETYYYLKDQHMFDSLVLIFYQNKLYAYKGFITTKRKTSELYYFLAANFNGKKYDKHKYFSSSKKDYYLLLSPENNDSLYNFFFIENNIYDTFIFHCGTYRRFFFWKNTYSRWNEFARAKKKKKLQQKLGITKSFN